MVGRKKIYKEIDRLMPGYIKFLSSLIKTDSSYGHEEYVQALIRGRMKKMGLNVKSYLSRKSKESVNLVSVISGSGRRSYRSLILNAHSDIAPVDCPSQWRREPFSGDIEKGVIYGRGAQDDKAGIAIILLIVNAFRNAGVSLKGDLIAEFVVGDETDGEGSRKLVSKGYRADGVIICDGTWAETIIYAHLGQVWIDAEIKGEPVAACVEKRGVNPIYIGMEFIRRLRKFIDKLNSSGKKFEGIEEPYFINVGSFVSGEWNGSVPFNASIKIQIGFPAGHSPDSIVREVSKIASEVSDRIGVRAGLLKTRAYKSDKNSLLIKKLSSIIEKNSGKKARIVPVTGHCDMRHFPTGDICLYGPGGGKNAHGADECYYLDEMKKVVRNITDFVLEWCNGTK